MFLLGTIVFIQAEKNLHEHSIDLDKFAVKHDAVIEKVTACSLCDFQLTAGAELLTNSTEAYTPPVGTEFTSAYQCDHTLSAVFTFQERGPPSIG